MRLGYARVSTKEQNEARQLEALQTARVDPENIHLDKISGVTRNRPALIELIAYLRKGDCVVVSSMDRLARSMIDLHSLVEEINNKGASVEFVKEGQIYSPDTQDPMSRLLLGVLGSFAEFERNLTRARQTEGISAAKARGVYTGRKRSVDRKKVAALLESGKTKTEIARQMGINRLTVLRIEKELKDPPS